MKPNVMTMMGLTIVVVLAIVLLHKLSTRAKLGKYQRRNLMTENEREFFGRLLTALPEHLIFPQVAMTAIIEASSTDRDRAYRDRLRIAQQRVDYLVCSHRGDIVVVIELDDKTHVPEKDHVRDKRLLQAGIRTIRFQSRNKPTHALIRAAVLPQPLPTLESSNV